MTIELIVDSLNCSQQTIQTLSKMWLILITFIRFVFHNNNDTTITVTVNAISKPLQSSHKLRSVSPNPSNELKTKKVDILMNFIN